MTSLLEAVSPTAKAILKHQPATPKNSPAMLDVFGAVEKQIAADGLRESFDGFSTDAKLMWMNYKIGQIGSTCETRVAVKCVAALAFVWLETLGVASAEVLAFVTAERVRQRELFSAGEHLFRVDSKWVGELRKLRVLIEEFGEVAEAIDDCERYPNSANRREHLIEELIQVAAVCVAWLESFEVKS